MNQQLITFFFGHLHLVYWSITALMILLGMYLAGQILRGPKHNTR